MHVTATYAVGRVARPRGLAGEVIVRGEPDELPLITESASVVLRTEEGVREMRVTRLRQVKGGLALMLEGISGVDEAEALRGAVVEIDVSALPAPSAAAFRWLQIEGFEVLTTGGERLGVAEERIRTGANDVLVVRREGRPDVLIPASPNVLVGVDPVARTLTVDPIPGLLDLNEG